MGRGHFAYLSQYHSGNTIFRLFKSGFDRQCSLLRSISFFFFFKKKTIPILLDLTTLRRIMPPVFFPPEALDYVRQCVAHRFEEEVKLAKESAVVASVYHVEDQVKRYEKFIDQLVCFFVFICRTA